LTHCCQQRTRFVLPIPIYFQRKIHSNFPFHFFLFFLFVSVSVCLFF
jgi:hypothetical protein